MGYTLFDYIPGHIDVRFSHEPECDFINLDIRIVGDITTTREYDEQGRKTEPVNHQKEEVDFTVYVSSVFCPFRDFIRFLEAITLEVQECAFEWEAEGPHGKMHWRRRFIQDTGFLSVEWSSSKAKFNHSVMLNTRQAVRTLYSAFRAFVDSPDYDPLRYEALTNGEAFALLLFNASLDHLAGTIARMNASAAEIVLMRLEDVISERHMKGPKLGYPIEHFLDAPETSTPPREQDAWIDHKWDRWDIDHRMNHLKSVFSWRSMGWDGANLRIMRSKLIEDWLALPETRSRSHQIRRSVRVEDVPDRQGSQARLFDA